MRTWYADEPWRPLDGQQSLFLAGPSPRSAEVESWRPEALRLLREALGFRGVAYVPETADGRPKPTYHDQVEWEYAALHAADAIVFWVPRELRLLPGLTTNVEFGYWMATRPEKVVYGRPVDSVKNRYLDWLYQKQTARAPTVTLLETLQSGLDALARAGR